MDRYVEQNSLLVLFVEWGGVIVLLSLVLAPFGMLYLRRYRSQSWKHIIGTYGISILVYIAILVFIPFVKSSLEETFGSSYWLVRSIEEASFKVSWLYPFAVLPMSIFYVTYIKFKNLTGKRLYWASFGALSLVIVFSAIFSFYLVVAIGGSGS